MDFPFRSVLAAHWRELRRGEPGRRFQDRYERARRAPRRRALVRVGWIVLAVVFLAVGVVLTVMPGPAILFFFLAGGLLASESRVVARGMDGAEVRLRRLLRWLQHRWRERRHGDRDSSLARR